MIRSIMLGCYCLLLCSCNPGYIASEITGAAKPEGGIREHVPESRSYSATHNAVWQACLDVLDQQGYLLQTDSGSGFIKTDPKPLGDIDKFQFTGATYYAIVSVKVSDSSVTYRARFNKKSNLVMAEENREYPEKENELRKEFFTALDAKLNK